MSHFRSRATKGNYELKTTRSSLTRKKKLTEQTNLNMSSLHSENPVTLADDTVSILSRKIVSIATYVTQQQLDRDQVEKPQN